MNCTNKAIYRDIPSLIERILTVCSATKKDKLLLVDRTCHLSQLKGFVPKNISLYVSKQGFPSTALHGNFKTYFELKVQSSQQKPQIFAHAALSNLYICSDFYYYLFTN